MTKNEKIAHLEAQLKKAQEEGNETYLKYLQRIRKIVINMAEGSTVVFQSGTPPPPPPYGGG